MSRRKQFSGLAMSKHSKIWRNRYISTRKKVNIYNSYVRSILTYNCSTWVSNKTIANSLNAFHRKQLRRCMNIYYPKIIKNDDLYAKTRAEPISDFINVAITVILDRSEKFYISPWMHYINILLLSS